jgi:hypothetical protein
MCFTMVGLRVYENMIRGTQDLIFVGFLVCNCIGKRLYVVCETYLYICCITISFSGTNLVHEISYTCT